MTQHAWIMTARTFAWTGFLAVAAFTLMVASRFSLLDPIENVTLTVTEPLQTALSDATRPVADWVNNVTDAGALSAENRRLREENERLTNELSRARAGEVDAQDLRDLAEVQAEFPDDTFLGARIVARDSSNVRSVVAINRGKSDGLREGMIVVTKGRSLVGTVSRTFDDYAWVTLMTDPKSAVSAMVQESRAQGVVAGDYGGDLLMEFVGRGAVVKEGDFVVTSGLGGGYPEGIVIGRVGKVSSRDQDLFQDVHVEPLAALAGLESVLVLLSFEPIVLEAP